MNLSYNLIYWLEITLIEVLSSFFHDILTTNEIYLREEQYLEYTYDKYENTGGTK